MHSILLVDDHAIVRSGLRMILSDVLPNAVVEESECEQSMLVQLREKDFQLVIMDIQMPGTNSIGMVEYTRIKYPQSKILVFSMMPEDIYGLRLMKAGAMGYLSKDASVEEIRLAVATVLKRKKYISQRLAQLLANEVSLRKPTNPFAQLSHREFEIAAGLLSGLNITQIAVQLNLQPSTISTYKARIYQKLSVDTLFQLKDLASLYHFDVGRKQNLN